VVRYEYLEWAVAFVDDPQSHQFGEITHYVGLSEYSLEKINELGAKGWRFSCKISNNVWLFERPLPDELS